MELSACIVVYTGADEALRAAQTVLDCTRRHPLTLYLVDNASPDGSGQCLAKAAKDGTLHIREDQKVEVLCRTENGGFGTGHNTVLSLLQSRVHFILNPDIQLTADTLSDLADWMAQHPGVVMARPALTFADGRPQRCAPGRSFRRQSDQGRTKDRGVAAIVAGRHACGHEIVSPPQALVAGAARLVHRPGRTRIPRFVPCRGSWRRLQRAPVLGRGRNRGHRKI